MTPLIFLDFDGVLNGYADPCGGGLRGLDPVRVARLNRIVDATGAHVVVTSAWRRIYRERCQLADILVAAGFTGMVAGMTRTDVPATDCNGWTQRLAEIEEWLQCPPRKYRGAPICIIDDEHDFGRLSDLVVRTHPLDGLTDEDVLRAIELLR